MSVFDLTLTIIQFALGGALFFLTVTVLRDNLSVRLNRLTALLFFFTALAPIFWALGSVIKQYPSSSSPFEESSLYTLSYIWELYFPTITLFALGYTAHSQRRKRRRLLLYLLFLPQLMHLAANLIFQNADGLLASLIVENPSGAFDSFLEELFLKLQWLVLYTNVLLEKQDRIFPLINSAYVVAAVVALYQGLRSAYNQTFKKQTVVILSSIALPGLIYFAIFAVNGYFELELSDRALAVALTLAALLQTLGFLWAIIRYQFLNIGLAVRQSVVYTISTGILVGLYLIVFDYFNDWIAKLTSGEGIALYVGFVTLALIFFQPINSQIEELIRGLFLRSRADFRNLIEDFSRRTISVFEPAKLRAIIEDNLKEHLMVEHVYFTLYDDRVREYALLPTDNFPTKHIIDRQDPYLGAIGQLTRAAPIEELSGFAEGSRLAKELSERETKLIFPLRDADRLLGFIALTGKVSGSNYSQEEMNLLQVLSNQLVGALTNARLYAETVEKRRLEEEVAMARQIQIGLLPSKLPRGVGFALAAHSVTSRTVGGDFYDVIELGENRFGLVIADASGKGMPAAMVITQIQAMIRSELNNKVDIRRALENINNYLVALTSPEKYATLCFGIFDSAASSFEYVNAGHNYPTLIRNNGECVRLSVGGMIVGAFPGAEYQSERVTLSGGDFIFFFTDGISETMNEQDEEYGEERLERLLCQMARDELTPDDIIARTLSDVDGFFKEDPPSDDRTIVVLKSI